MNRWQQLRYLDWPRFLRAFFVIDVSALVIPAWALALRMTGAPEDSDGLDSLRQICSDADQELRDLLDDASERAGQDAPGS